MGLAVVVDGGRVVGPLDVRIHEVEPRLAKDDVEPLEGGDMELVGVDVGPEREAGWEKEGAGLDRAVSQMDDVG